MDSKSQNIELIYNEAKSSWDFQLHALNSVYTKSNWLVAVNGVMFAAILSMDDFRGPFEILVIITITISLSFALANYWPRNTKRGAGLKYIIADKDKDYIETLAKLARDKNDTIAENNLVLNSLNKNLKLSIVFLCVALAFLFVYIIIDNICYVI